MRDLGGIREFATNEDMLRFLRGKAEFFEPVEKKEEKKETPKKKSSPKKKKESEK